MSFPEPVTSYGDPSDEATTDLDGLRSAWRQLMAARTSAQHYRARLRRTTLAVAEMTVIDPQLSRAVRVLTALTASFDLAEEAIGSLRPPNDLIEAVPSATDPEQP